jgi:hypothetical protein
VILITSPSVPFDPEDYFTWASTIARNPASSEAELRSSISRAYYAVFLVTRDTLFGGIDAPDLTRRVRDKLRIRYGGRLGAAGGPGSHEVVLSAANEAAIQTKVIVSLQQLVQLEHSRILADYWRVPTHYHLAPVQVTSWLQFARDSLALASGLLPTVKRLPRFRSVVRL